MKGGSKMTLLGPKRILLPADLRAPNSMVKDFERFFGNSQAMQVTEQGHGTTIQGSGNGNMVLINSSITIRSNGPVILNGLFVNSKITIDTPGPVIIGGLPTDRQAREILFRHMVELVHLAQAADAAKMLEGGEFDTVRLLKKIGNSRAKDCAMDRTLRSLWLAQKLKHEMEKDNKLGDLKPIVALDATRKRISLPEAEKRVIEQAAPAIKEAAKKNTGVLVKPNVLNAVGYGGQDKPALVIEPIIIK